jgi:TonB family protein
MFKRQKLAGIVVLAISSVLLAQTTETKPPDVGSSEAASPRGHYSAAPGPNPCQRGAPPHQAEILTDTMGVDFGPYLAQISKTVQKNWYALLPPSVYPPVSKQGSVSIEFSIFKDGKVSGMTLHTTSGDIALDRAAWASITASSPFPLLPSEFRGQRLGLRLNYYYNSSPDFSPISISPCAGVRVPAGSTLQFSASGKGITDSSVTWSVSGSGCSKSECGTISDTGLYTAPANIPSPPTVTVEATSRNTSGTAKSKLTVVQANPSH